MPGQKNQMMLFEVRTSKRDDGVFEIVPVTVYADREISVAAAMALLKYKCPKRIYSLLNRGKIRGWKNDSEGGNAHWHIFEASVLEYKNSRRNVRAAAGGPARMFR